MSRTPGNDARAVADGPQGKAATDLLPPRQGDVASLAHEGVQLRGHAPVSRLRRLAEEFASHPDPHAGSAGAAQGASAGMDWTMAFSMRASQGRAAQPWLHLCARAPVPLTCQRCLGPVLTLLEVERDFRFVADEQTAEHEDEDSEEDVLALSRPVDLQALLEDELLMALPLVPRHESCPGLTGQSHQGALQPLPEKPNPFAVLRHLKPPGGGEGGELG